MEIRLSARKATADREGELQQLVADEQEKRVEIERQERERLEREYERTQQELEDLMAREAELKGRRVEQEAGRNDAQVLGAGRPADVTWSRITEVDRFYGGPKDDFQSWLFRLNTIASLEGWSEQKKIRQAIVALSGCVLSQYRANVASAEDKDQMTWNDFVSVMRKRFGSSRPIQYWNQKLVTIRQGSQETVRVYWSVPSSSFPVAYLWGWSIT